MHRVELVVYLDRAKCKKWAAYDIIERIERGEFPDVSMGCKVPFDVCTICGHKSKTRKDYCSHASSMMNKILPDGRKVAVRNDFPRFFDISFVFIGADKSAKVLAKLAQRGRQVCLGDFCAVPQLSADLGEVFTSPDIKEKLSEVRHVQGCACGVCTTNAKTAGFALRPKSASHSKLSEIIKEVPAGPFFEKDLPRVEKSEADIPSHVLNGIAANHKLDDVLSSTSSLGIVLKPKEFQRIVLIKSSPHGRSLADRLESLNSVFGHTRHIDPMDIPMSGGLDVIKRLLMPFLAARCCASPILRKRITIVARMKPAMSSPTPITGDDLMDKMSALYNGYRRDLVKKAAIVENQLLSDPQLLHEIAGSSIAQAFGGGFEKTASVLGPEALAYLVGAQLP